MVSTQAEKLPRKGSNEWLLWHLESGAKLYGARDNSAMAWHYTLYHEGHSHPVTETRVRSLLAKHAVRARLRESGDDAWNRIDYTLA